MLTTPLLRGFVLGLAIAAPVGPIGLLCIGRTLNEGRVHGFVTGLGAATADAIYGAVAAFGLTSLAEVLVGYQIPIRILGGVFLVYLGIRTALARPRPAMQTGPSSSLPAAYASTFFLTLTNPVTILSFAAVYAGLGVGAAGWSVSSSLAIVAGVFVGSSSWWFLLSAAVSLLRDRIELVALVWINRVAGALLLAFGAAALISAL
jgi:threonine/homoserine/homoserine lactone efflux protein